MRPSRVLLLSCVVSLPLAAAEEPEDLLLRIRQKCVSTLDRLPRYMCTQTIDRDYFEPVEHVQYQSCDDLLGQKRRKPAALQRVSSDRLRLNVATASVGELYSWAGDTKFNDSGLFDLIDNGPLQTGSFASALTMIFTNDEATFSYIGENIEDGRRLVEFGFRTPQNRSHYTFGPKDHRTRVAYEGTFTADAQTVDLVRMTMRTVGIPEDFGTCETTTTLDYHRVRLRNAEFLLPSQTQLHMVLSSGQENHSRTVFSACHEFLGESTLKFDAPDVTAEATPGVAAESKTVVLPKGQPFGVMLTDGIDTGIAAAGDPVHGKLTSAIRSKRPKVEIPAGAAVLGRIIKLEHEHGKGESVRIAVRLETIEVNGAAVPFTARFEIMPVIPRRSQSFGLQSRGLEMGRMSDLHPRGVAVFTFRNAGEHYLVRSGLESRWVTLGR